MVMSANARASRLDDLRLHIRSLGSALICYSGGIDSALVLAVATEQLGERAIGLTAVSASLPQDERADAERLPHELKADVRFVESHEIDKPLYARNAEDRCFHCKTELYELAEQKRVQLGLQYIINGKI